MCAAWVTLCASLACVVSGWLLGSDKTGSPSRGGGQTSGELSVSCCASGAGAAAMARPLALSAKSCQPTPTPVPRSTATTAPRPQVLSSGAYMTDGLELRSKAVTPDHFQPKNDERGAENGRPEHCPQGDKRLIPTCRDAVDQLLDETQARPSPGRSHRGLWAAWRRVKRSGSRSLTSAFLWVGMRAPSTCQVGLVGCRRLAVGIGFIANPCNRLRPRSRISGSWKFYARRQ